MRSAAAAWPISSSLACAASRAAVVRRVSLGQLQPQPFQRRLRLPPHAPRQRFRARARPPACARVDFDRFAEQPITLGELDLLPAPQLLAQAAIPPRLCRLPLERAALLLDLEDDVVDARQVLLRRLELQFRGPPPALVLRHAGRFLDQLPSIGRTGAEDLPDLALLDDRVCLDAQPCVHQQILDVAQPDGLAVDQVFALARSIQTAHHFDVAHDERRSSSHGDAAGRRAARRIRLTIVCEPSAGSRNVPGTRAATPPSFNRTSAARSACGHRCRRR